MPRECREVEVAQPLCFGGRCARVGRAEPGRGRVARFEGGLDAVTPVPLLGCCQAQCFAPSLPSAALADHTDSQQCVPPWSPACSWRWRWLPCPPQGELLVPGYLARHRVGSAAAVQHCRARLRLGGSPRCRRFRRRRRRRRRAQSTLCYHAAPTSLGAVRATPALPPPPYLPAAAAWPPWSLAASPAPSARSRSASPASSPTLPRLSSRRQCLPSPPSSAPAYGA